MNALNLQVRVDELDFVRMGLGLRAKRLGLMAQGLGLMVQG